MKTVLLFLVIAWSLTTNAQNSESPMGFLKTQKKRVNVIREAAQFTAGDRVADIGSGNGWFPAALGIYTDSLAFTLEEIDSAFLRDDQFRKAIADYERVRGQRFTNTYQWVIGTEKSTTLPSGSFDKVLLLDVFHHISFRDEMIADLYAILKPGGLLVVLEPVARKEGQIYKGCRSRIFPPQVIAAAFASKGFLHERTLKTVKSTRTRVRVIVFRKPPEKLQVSSY